MSETFHIHCEVCDTKLRVPEESRGLAVKCPHCEHVQHVPTLNEESMSDTAIEDPTSADFAENLSELADDHEIQCPNCEEMIPAGQPFAVIVVTTKKLGLLLPRGQLHTRRHDAKS